MTGPIDYCRAVVAAAGEHRQLHIRCHADGSLDFIRVFDGGPIPTQAEIEAAWAAMPPPARVWTTLEFIERFPPDKQLALISSTDPVVKLFIAKATAAGTVREDDERLQEGMAYFVSSGLLSQAERDSIMTGP